MRPTRILFVYQYLTLGGVEVVMQTRLRELARRGINARGLFLAESSGGESIFKKMGDQIAVCTEEAEIEEYLAAFNPDWISTIDTPGIIPIARRIVPDARIAYEVHTTYPDNYALVLDRNLLDSVIGIIVPSQAQKEFIELRIARPLPVEVVPNALPEEFFQTAASNRSKSNIVMWVGRLDELKNWRGFIELAEQVRERIKAEFWIVGGLRNHETTALFAAIQKAGLIDSVRWLPAVSYEDMPRLYGFVGRSEGCLVSTSWGEAFGMAALEAMASCCPVIAADVGGLRDIIRHGETGWLYPAMDIHRACHFVVEAIQDLDARQTVIENARREAQKFTPSTTVDKLLAVFSEWSNALPKPATALPERRRVEQLLRNAESQATQAVERSTLFHALSVPLDDAGTKKLIEITGAEQSSLGTAVLSQQQSVIKRVRESKGAVIFLPSMAWETDFFQRPHHLARHFAKLGYVSIFHTTSGQDEVIGFKEVEPNLYLFNGPEAVVHGISDPILWTFTYNYQLSDGYRASARLVYDMIDDMAVFPGDPALLKENHSRALKEADVVASVSRSLLDQLIGVRPDAIYLPNAVEAERFADDSIAVPGDPEIASLLEERKPIAGYYGVFAEWFDYELLGSVADSRPDWNFLLIGPAYDNSFKERGERLIDHPNVRWIGSRRYESLAGYLRLFDVALIPFVINNITRSVSPLKLYEYFAGGKPVITTPMPECESMADVHIARNAEEFSRSLDEVRTKGFNEDYQRRVRRLARENSWFARAQTVIELLQRKVKDDNGAPQRRSSSESVLERDESLEPAIVGAEMIDLLSAQLAATHKVINDRDQGINWLSSRTANLERIVQTRDEALEWLSAKLAAQERESQAFEETVRLRDEGIAWLQCEWAESKKTIEHHESLRAQLANFEETVKQREKTLEAIKNELAGQINKGSNLEAQLREKDELLRQGDEILEARNVAIDWLKKELEESQINGQRLTDSQESLTMELAKTKDAMQAIREELAAKDLELEKMTNTIWWRLLSRYGRIKYRYLLPVYRLFGRAPQSNRSQRVLK